MLLESRIDRRSFLAAVVVVGVTACGGEPSDLTGPTPPSSAVTVSATVLEFTMSGERIPVPNLRLKVRIAGNTGSPADGHQLPDVVSGSDGRYVISDVPLTGPVTVLFIETAPESAHRFLCSAYPLFVSRASPRPGDHDLPVVHASWSGNKLPPGMWIPGTSVTGTVSGRLSGQLQPLAGATVTLEGGTQEITSGTGFYMACSVVGTDQVTTITARKDGYRTVTEEIFNASVVDFELDPD